MRVPSRQYEDHVRRERARRAQARARLSLFPLLLALLFVAPAQLLVRRYNELRVRVLGAKRYIREYATAGTGTSADPWTGWESAIDGTANVRYHFENGYFSTPTEVTLSALKGGIVSGGGIGRTVVTFTGVGTHGFYVHNGAGQVQNFVIEHLSIRAVASHGTGGYAVGLEGAGYCTVRHVGTETDGAVLWHAGVWVHDNSHANLISRCVIFGYGANETTIGAGIFFEADGVGNGDANYNVAEYCIFVRGGQAVAAIWDKSCTGNSVIGCDLEGGGSRQNIRLDGSKSFTVLYTDFEQVLPDSPVSVAHISTQKDAANQMVEGLRIAYSKFASVNGQVCVNLVGAEGTEIGPNDVPSFVTTYVAIGAETTKTKVRLSGKENTDGLVGVEGVTGATIANETIIETEFAFYGLRQLWFHVNAWTGIWNDGDTTGESLALGVTNAAGNGIENRFRMKRNENNKMVNNRALDAHTGGGSDAPGARFEAGGVRFGNNAGGALDTLLAWLSSGRLGVNGSSVLLDADKNVDGGLVRINGSGGGATRGAQIPVVAAAPGAPSAGEMWVLSAGTDFYIRSASGFNRRLQSDSDKGTANGIGSLGADALQPEAQLATATTSRRGGVLKAAARTAAEPGALGADGVASGAMQTPDAPAVYTEGAMQAELDKLKANDDDLKARLDALVSSYNTTKAQLAAEIARRQDLETKLGTAGSA